MSEPVLPPHICPKLDKIASAVKAVCRLKAIHYDSADELLDGVQSELWNVEDWIEDVRDATTKLREVAEYWRDECEAERQGVNA